MTARAEALGVEDTISLGGLLASGRAIPAILAKFEALCRSRIALVQRMTDRMSPPFVGPEGYRRTYEPLRRSA
ncbi:hypothetical protein PK98_01805 [Croceibacterium mercuriale]|uniref:Uncharacterized protein n=1 Tax=Croceibacterium mercuriale TaxID=1572751 RepID=A0A0B2BV09_9SPHN|nr:hypothetical protein [Croceibacterium mercuriale]KHL25458.1 hypothetical protein PK98_01805 [Croceibacterium mercuriale]